MATATKTSILGFTKLNATLTVAGVTRQASVSAYNYQNTPKRVVRALADGQGVTPLSVYVDGVQRYGGICTGRDVGDNNSVKPGLKINFFWATPQAEKTHQSNSYVDENDETVNHRCDWIPLDRNEWSALEAGERFDIATVGVKIKAPTAVVEAPVEPVVEAPAPVVKVVKGRKAKRPEAEPALV